MTVDIYVRNGFYSISGEQSKSYQDSRTKFHPNFPSDLEVYISVPTYKGTQPFQHVLSCVRTHQNYTRNIPTADQTLDLELRGKFPKLLQLQNRQKQIVDCFDVLLRAE